MTVRLGQIVENSNLTPDDQPSETAPSELVSVVDDLLNQLQTKFVNVSAELVGKRMSCVNLSW